MSDILKTGLALSGGGFRATLFHLGTLHRLNQAGWLRRLDIITSVSGGSIIAGVLAQRWNKLRWVAKAHGEVADNFADAIEAPLRDFCSRTIDVSAGLLGMANPFSSIAEEVEEAYDDHLFDHARLQALPEAKPGQTPRFVFYATSLQTGSSVRISRKYLADYKVGIIDAPDFTLAKVVAASSAFPPVLSPVKFKIKDPSIWRRVEGATLYDQEEYRQRLVLADGGVYDNLGLEAIADRCETVLASDAGAPFTPNSDPDTGVTDQLARVRDILIEQTRALRKRHLVDEFVAKRRKGAYWGIATRIGDYGLPDALVKDNATTGVLKDIRTRLNKFSATEQGQLINWGYALADAALRGRVEPGGTLPRGTWPDRDFPL